MFPPFPAPAAVSRPFPACPAPAPSRLSSDAFPILFSPLPAPAPAAAPAPCAPTLPSPVFLLNDLIASGLGWPLFTDAWRFRSLAAACCRSSCCEVGGIFLAFCAAALCSAVGCAFTPLGPLKLARLAFTCLFVTERST
ncbi:MAG: hypothetical protein DME78_03670 [Verrucomicrobia bacterium]|nr:MAG: hypothetical protein DME78_03670 [Verrucomicrobiota bacterium]